MTTSGHYTGPPAAVLEAAYRATIDQQPVHTTCLWCDWVADAAAGEGRALFLAHRLTKHPDVKPRRRGRGQAPGVYALNVKGFRDDRQRSEAMAAVRLRRATTHYDGEAA